MNRIQNKIRTMMQNKTQWTRRKAASVALAVTGVTVAGLLAVGSAVGVSAQSGTPGARTAGSGPLAMAQRWIGGGREMRGGHRGPGGPESIAAAATVLGIDDAALDAELQGGKTIADVAKAKGVDVAKVVAAIVDAEKADIAQHVKDGDMTQAQADQMLADVEARVTDMVNNGMPQRGPRGGDFGRGPGGPRGMAEAAKALGIDEAALQTELQGGKTIADVAKAKGVELSTIVDAIIATHKTELAQAVTDGKMTQSQADAILGGEKARVELMLNGQMPQGGPRGGDFGPGHGRGHGGQGGHGGRGGRGGPGYPPDAQPTPDSSSPNGQGG